MLSYLVEIELNYRKVKGTYTGSFSAICSFIGYQARGALPSPFDSAYAYNLGHACIAAVAAGLTGHLVTINNLKASVSEWGVTSVPLVSMFERDLKTQKLNIPVTFVDISGPAYLALESMKSISTVSQR
jgi:6-phosphofructokinase